MNHIDMLDVVIVGGGHAGLMLGAGLARQGFSLALVDPQPLASMRKPRADGRSLALLAGSVRVAESLGLWPHLAPHVSPIERVEVTDVAAGAVVSYDSEAHGTGSFGVGVEHARLRTALLDAFLASAGPECLIQGELASLRREGGRISATLASGRTLASRLLIGADGRGSRVRELARIGVDRWAYGQSAVTLVLAGGHGHGQMVREWLRPGGPLATLPLPAGRTGITWVEPTAEAARLAELDPDTLLQTLADITGGVLGAVTLESGPSIYPLGAQHARHYVAPRVALVGDAAHGVHPIHAQGFNMGVADNGSLVEALVDARTRGLDLGSGEALLPYVRRRRTDNTQRLWLTDSLVRMFRADLPAVRAARGLALNAIERIGPLKRLAVRHGMQTG